MELCLYLLADVFHVGHFVRWNGHSTTLKNYVKTNNFDESVIEKHIWVLRFELQASMN
jgi:hypothetical protein